MTNQNKIIYGAIAIVALGGIYFLVRKNIRNAFSPPVNDVKTSSVPQNIQPITNPTEADVKLVAGGRGH